MDRVQGLVRSEDVEKRRPEKEFRYYDMEFSGPVITFLHNFLKHLFPMAQLPGRF